MVEGRNYLSKLTAIENAIIQLGDGDFQKFCDTFLSQKQYGKIHGLGMKSGTLKTTIGNPDTYFRKENGKYVFVAYTTQQSSIYGKLKEDIDKCLDPQKTKLPVEEIEEIICCHTSSNLLAGDDNKLHKLCEEKGIKLTVFGVDELAQQVYKYYPLIAKDFLGISVDTNQIMYVDEFVALYDSNDMAAPLDTIFHGRKEELPNVIQAIKDNKVVIVHGPAGTGKTRIVLEAIRQVATDDDYRLFCVKNNNQPIYEDLISKIEQTGRYLLFVDDANELTGLEHVLQYVNKTNPEFFFKVVLTVRDYVKEQVIQIANKYAVSKTILMYPFSDDDIKEFLDINMGITNSLYVDQIIKIAEGNPRIAYMAGKIAKDTQSLSSVHDASQVYEQYYSNIVEIKMGKDRDLCLTAGILALVNAVFINKMECLSRLLEKSGITEDIFRKCIYILSQMEVVEIHKDQVAAISDQCLSNYMLYYAFFREKMVPFSEVLYVGYKHFKNGVVRSINTLFNIFSNKDLCEYIAEQVRMVWEKYENEKEECFNDFVITFHTFQPEEAFLIAADKIGSIEQIDYNGEQIDFTKSTRNADNDIISLLSGYGYSSYLETAVELLIEYASKSPEKAINGVNFIKNTYSIDQDSYRYAFYTEKKICNVLSKYQGENSCVLNFILEVVKEYLKFEFRPTEMWRGNTFRFYHLELQNTADVKAYRAICWDIILNLLHTDSLRITIGDFIKNYAVSIRGASDANILVDDKKYIDSIMEAISLNNVKRALIYRDLYYGWNRQNIEYERDNSVFETPEWQLLMVLDDDFIYSELEYEEYQNQREKKLKEYAEKVKAGDIENLIKTSAQIADEAQFTHSKDKHYTISHSLGQIANEISVDGEKAESMMRAVMEYAGELDVYPGVMMTSLFKIFTAQELFRMIDERNFLYKNAWEFYYFDLIPEEMVDEDVFKQFITYLMNESDKEIKSSSWRNLRFIEKFKKYDEDIYVTVSKIIYDKRKYSAFIVEIYFTPLFNEHWYKPNEVINLYKSDLELLKQIYFFMLGTNSLDDLKGEFLLQFLSIGDEWVEAFADYVANNINNERGHDYYRYNALWYSDNYSRYYDCIFQKLANSEAYISEWRLADLFKSILSHGKENETIKSRQETWIMHIIEENANSESVIVIFEALLEADTNLRKKALLSFLSKNSDYELFRLIPLDPSHWGGNVDEIIPQLTERIEFLESLLLEIKGAKYLKHCKRIKDRIDMWKAEIKDEEIKAICRKLYQ